MKMQSLKVITLALFIFCFASVSKINAQSRAYKATDSQVQYLLNRIKTRTYTFKRAFTRAIDSSRLNNTDTEDMANNYVADFENATDALKQKFASRDSVDADVQDVLNRAAYINQFLRNNRLTTGVQTNWNYIRTDLNTLARYYSVSSNWTNPVSVGTGNGTGNSTRTPYTVSDNTLRTLLVRIQTRTDMFKSSAQRALNRNGADNSDNITSFINAFESDTSRLQQNFDANRSALGDVREVLNSAAAIDEHLKNNRLNPAAQRDWTSLRTDLSTLASYYNVSWNWNNQNGNTTSGNNTNNGGGSTGAGARNVQNLIARLETRTDAYKREINAALDRSILNNTRSEESIFAYITDFETATDKLKQNFNARRATAADVEEVLNRAYYIDSFMRDYRLSVNAENQWKLIRTDLDALSNNYNVSWNWNNRQYAPQSRFDQMLTGTYRLNVSQSDNVGDVVGRAATAYYPGAQGDRSRANLERRLTSPDTLVIEKRDKQVTIASSLSPQISFNADGTTRSETTANGRIIKVTANTTYDGVALSYEGDRINDFYVNFIPLSSGQLKVVRRVYLENRSDTVTVASVYDKISTSANFSNLGNQNTGQNTTTTDFAVPNNTRLTAVMRTAISTKTSQSNDRFTMEVTSPSEFNGAIIEGRVTNAQRSGQVSGRANLSLEFDTIRLRNGGTYRFAGIVDQVRLASGETVSVNNEGTVRDNNQTTKTVTRAGIGAALGALIGAIAGGGQGAAIGAAVGAGAGAGTVILQGKDDVELMPGTEVTITSSAPNNINR